MNENKKTFLFILFLAFLAIFLVAIDCNHEKNKSKQQTMLQQTTALKVSTTPSTATEATTEEILENDQVTAFFDLLEDTAKIMLDYQFTYGNARATLQREIDGNRRSNCASYISYVLQDMGIIPKGQMFYCNRDVTLKGDAAEELMKEKYFKILYPDDTVENVKFKPGDIVGIAGKKWQHTMVFVGYREDGKTLWYSGGNDATKGGSKEFSPKKLGVVRRVSCYENKHCIMILRWKKPHKKIQYTRKYIERTAD